MNSYPKFTIVTPSFNQGKFIEETIKSVINQDYPNIEYIVLDAGSSDDTCLILEKYTDRINHWVSKPDNGQTDAINTGFHMATGEFVGWLNSDDYLEPQVLWDIYEAFKDNQVGTVCGSLNIIEEDGELIQIRKSDFLTFDNLLNGTAQVLQPGSFHRKSLIDQYGYLDASLNYVMDFDFWLKLGQHSNYIQLNKIVANHRMHKSSKTQAEYAKFIPEIKRVRSKFKGKSFCKKSLGILRCELGLHRRKLIGS
jgi:glycosyltransferase involved in cell wall biosynthesis